MFADAFNEAIRSFLWLIASFILSLMDWVYNILLSFFALNLDNFSWIWDIYWVLTSAIGMFILFRVVFMFFHAYYDDQSAIDKGVGNTIVNRILMVGLIVTLIPIGLPILSKVVSNATSIIDLDTTAAPSQIILESGCADFDDNFNSAITFNVPEGETALSVINADGINKKVDGSYVYMNKTENILLVVFMSGMTIYVLVMIAMQIIQRMIGLLMKIIIAPYAVSGLVDPNDNSCSMWFKLCIADFMTAFFQMMMLWVVMYAASHFPEGWGVLTKGIFFVSALFTILIAPQGIASLIGGDVGAQTGMQMMAQMHAMTGALSTASHLTMGAFSLSANAAKQVAGGAFSLGTYGMGRLMGAQSLNPARARLGQGGSNNDPDHPYGGGSDFGSNDDPYGGGGNDNPFGGGGCNYGGGGSGFGGGSSSGYSPYGGNSLNESSASYGSATGLNASDINPFMGGADPVDQTQQSYVGDDGILHYKDGSVTSGGKRMFSYNGAWTPRSKMGAMAGTLASYAYQKSAQRLFTNRNQQMQMKANRAPMSVRLSNAKIDLANNMNRASQNISGQTGTNPITDSPRQPLVNTGSNNRSSNTSDVARNSFSTGHQKASVSRIDGDNTYNHANFGSPALRFAEPSGQPVNKSNPSVQSNGNKAVYGNLNHVMPDSYSNYSNGMPDQQVTDTVQHGNRVNQTTGNINQQNVQRSMPENAEFLNDAVKEYLKNGEGEFK